MKPVTQTITGPTGNCMGACLASILEVPIETVPNFFDAGPDDTDWWNALRAWLRKFGLGIITLTFESPAQWTNLRLAGYHIVSGPSPRLEGMYHATVWHRGRMVHDPHPDGTGIVEPETLDMLYLIEPASLQLPASVIAAQLRGHESSALQPREPAPRLAAGTQEIEMQQLLETIKAKLEALEAEGVAGVREIILHAEEAIGLHKAATEEFAEGAELLPGATTGDLGEGVHVIGVDVQADRIVTDSVHAIPGIEVTEGAPETPADAAPASSDPAA